MMEREEGRWMYIRGEEQKGGGKDGEEDRRTERRREGWKGGEKDGEEDGDMGRRTDMRQEVQGG